MVSTILSSALFKELILPFLLVFTLIFAILEKTKLLGEEKKQIDAIVSFVIALILVAFPYPRDIIVGLMPFLAVLAVVILVFYLLIGFAHAGKEEFDPPKAIKITLTILISLALIIALLVLTGYWDTLFSFLEGGTGQTVATNVIFIIIIIVAIVVVLWSEKNKGGGMKE